MPRRLLKIGVVVSSVLLAGAYVSYQAGWVRLPFAGDERSEPRPGARPPVEVPERESVWSGRAMAVGKAPELPWNKGTVTVDSRIVDPRLISPFGVTLMSSSKVAPVHLPLQEFAQRFLVSDGGSSILLSPELSARWLESAAKVKEAGTLTGVAPVPPPSAIRGEPLLGVPLPLPGAALPLPRVTEWGSSSSTTHPSTRPVGEPGDGTARVRAQATQPKPVAGARDSGAVRFTPPAGAARGR